jgi:flagellar FliJ protein
MAKFKFRLELVERLRKQNEEQMRSRFGEAQKDVLKEHSKLQGMIDRAEEQTDILKEKIATGASPKEIALYEDFREGQKIRQKEQSDRLEDTVAIMVRSYQNWINSKKELNVIEKLKEKKREEFKKEQRKAEIKTMDDIVVMRQGQRVAGG